MTVIGIYRGNYKEKDIRDKVDKLKALQGKNENDEAEDIEDGDLDKDTSNQLRNIHYIDVIAVVQDLNI